MWNLILILLFANICVRVEGQIPPIIAVEYQAH